jgi:hypothetical protein
MLSAAHSVQEGWMGFIDYMWAFSPSDLMIQEEAIARRQDRRRAAAAHNIPERRVLTENEQVTAAHGEAPSMQLDHEEAGAPDAKSP